jgi:uncharacterized protein (DUF302 family)
MKIPQVAALVVLLILAAAGKTSASDGLITKPSAYSTAVTLDRLEAALKERGYMIFARLDHAAAAASVGLKMPPATVLIFGNPRNGTAAFLQKPALAIDLPLKALVWEDAGGKVSIAYNSAEYVQGIIYPRHGLPTNSQQQQVVESALAAATDAAVKK